MLWVFSPMASIQIITSGMHKGIHLFKVTIVSGRTQYTHTHTRYNLFLKLSSKFYLVQTTWLGSTKYVHVMYTREKIGMILTPHLKCQIYTYYTSIR